MGTRTLFTSCKRPLPVSCFSDPRRSDDSKRREASVGFPFFLLFLHYLLSETTHPAQDTGARLISALRLVRAISRSTYFSIDCGHVSLGLGFFLGHFPPSRGRVKQLAKLPTLSNAAAIL